MCHIFSIYRLNNEDIHFAYTHVVNNFCIMDIYILYIPIEGVSEAHVLA